MGNARSFRRRRRSLSDGPEPIPGDPHESLAGYLLRTHSPEIERRDPKAHHYGRLTQKAMGYLFLGLCALCFLIMIGVVVQWAVTAIWS